jgi:hypothetical protein
MNQLYREVSKEFLEGLRKYMKDEVSYRELKKLSTKERLAHDYRRWEDMVGEKSSELVRCYRTVYDKILRVEEHIKCAEKDGVGKSFEVTDKSLIAHSKMLGRNRSHPKGYEGSSWYLPPFPVLTMLDALNKEESDPS